jgi:hypothetical protein
MKAHARTLTLAIAVAAAFAVTAVPTFAAVTLRGNGVAKITVVTETNAQSTSSTSFINLPGAAASITVPSLATQLVNVRFSAESYCFGSSAGVGNWCSVRILVDGIEMLPNSGGDFAFDARGVADDFWEGHAMERTILLRGGTHSITVQWAVTSSAVTFRLDDWTLAVTQYNGGH